MGYRSAEFQPTFTAADEIREKTKIGSYTGSGVQLSEVYSNKEIVKPTVSIFCKGKIVCDLSQWRTMRDLRLIFFPLVVPRFSDALAWCSDCYRWLWTANRWHISVTRCSRFLSYWSGYKSQPEDNLRGASPPSPWTTALECRVTWRSRLVEVRSRAKSNLASSTQRSLCRKTAGSGASSIRFQRTANRLGLCKMTCSRQSSARGHGL